MSEYQEITYYTVHRDMIKKGALKRMIADTRIDRMKDEIIEIIESGKPLATMEFYKIIGTNGPNFERAVKRWGLDLEDIKRKIKNNSKGKKRHDWYSRVAEFAPNIPNIVYRLSRDNPDSIQSICGEFEVTSKFLHAAIRAQGIDSVQLGRNAYNKIRKNNNKAKAKKVADIKNNPLAMKWV